MLVVLLRAGAQVTAGTDRVQKKELASLELTRGCGPPDMGADTDSGPVEEEQLLLIAEPDLQLLMNMGFQWIKCPHAVQC